MWYYRCYCFRTYISVCRSNPDIRQSVKISSYVDEPQIPILFSFVPNVNPGVPFSTINAEISFCFLPRFSIVPVTAMIIYTSASLPFVMKHLDPLRKESSLVVQSLSSRILSLYLLILQQRLRQLSYWYTRQIRRKSSTRLITRLHTL